MNSFFGIDRLKDESDFEFLLRVCMAKHEKKIDADWQEIVEFFNLECHVDTLRKKFNGPFAMQHVIRHYEQLLQEAQIPEPTNAEVEIEKKRQQLAMEKIKVKDERTQLNRLLRLQARWEELLELIRTEVNHSALDKYIDEVNYYVTEQQNEAVLFVSDTHIGMTVDNALNVYNKQVCIERFNKLIQSTIKNCRRNDVTTLNVVLGGDIIEGIINLTGRIQQNEDVVQQIFTAAELVTQLIVELSRNIRKVNVWSTNGNHARMSKDTKEALDGESFESIVYEYVKIKIQLLQEQRLVGTNITLNENDYPDIAIIHINSCDKTIAASHGTKDRKAMNNVSRINSFLPITVDYYMIGHLHNSHHQNNCYVNGCLSGSNEWAQGQRYNNDPMQIMLVFYEDGSTTLCEMNLK